MENSISPELLAFVLQLGLYLLIAFGILLICVTIVYVSIFFKGNASGNLMVEIIRQTEVPKVATIILIILAASFLGLLQVIAGEAVIALLSGIAGYVLGNQATKRNEGEDGPD